MKATKTKEIKESEILHSMSSFSKFVFFEFPSGKLVSSSTGGNRKTNLVFVVLSKTRMFAELSQKV